MRPKPITEKDPWELKLDILEFAFNTGAKIHPDKDLEGFCKRTVESGHCICHDEETHCPCGPAAEMLLKQGYCTCRLFISPEFYGDALASARKRWQRKRQGG